MKNLVLILIAVAVVSCKPGGGCDPDPTDFLLGNWQWVQSSGGIDGATHTPDTDHTTRRLVFNADQIYQLYEADSITSTGKFTLSMGKFEGIPNADILTLGNSAPVRFIERGDSLILIAACCDQFSSKYVRLRVLGD